MESKSLNIIQKLAKVGEVLCKIVKTFSIIGFVGCIIGIISLVLGVDGVVKIGGISIHGIIEKSSNMSVGTMYANMAVVGILSLGEAILSTIAEKYFKNEQLAGTPFTFEGAKELQRLGICTICIPLVAMVLADISYYIINYTCTNVADLHIDKAQSVGLGIMFLILSVIFKYGAEVQQKETEY